MVLRLCAVSVDLDEIPHYRRLHGLPSSERAAGAVYERGLGRARALRRARHGAGRSTWPLAW